MERDMISEMPDTVFLHIMSFMNTKYAVQSCVLSKRWNHLCKRLINLTYSPVPNLPKKIGVERFKKFATWVLSTRDNSCSLHNLGLHLCWTEPELLDKIIKHALFCNVQQLILDVYSGFRPDFESLPLMFCSQSLTSLELCISWNYALIVLPKSLHMPVLKNLHLQGVTFTASDNDSCDPFSNCHLLNTLVLRYCSLHDDAQVLCISNSTLSSFTLYEGQTYQIQLSTPNLSSFTIRGSATHQLFSTCNLSFLEEVNIDMSWDARWAEKSSIISSNIMRWLQVLANVKKLTFTSWYPFQIMLHDFSNPTSMRPEPPSLVRLESLKVFKHFFVEVSDEKVNTVVEYLLRGSPMAKVHIIRRA
ncbi:putative F-box protein At1g58310 [Vigna unguiculata]|uniref:putative F-box protein At1g58310 n=1 Tax=Vigna unguiculata TaxID=3917 RepID=UPI0010160B92|nr:putative F-box protein At1g58310 [Vigna unguiculata]